MIEPGAHIETFGVLAEFASGEDLIEAAKTARKEGYRSLDAYTPFPMLGLTEALELNDNRVPWLTLGGGIVGAAAGYLMQVYTNHAYPIPVGNRPLVAPQAFMLITFEMMVLGAVLAGILGMLLLNRLPRLHHPVFEAERFGFHAEDRFFLVVFGNDARFHEEETSGFMKTLGATKVETLRNTEEPE
ncbi:DUF3341 domain-containing protein [Tianweitania populi]|uniref:DUF3341 domain-containing protein n=1 Tax=Tianweitania populi TaxID=1607949 RepID=A0A8J3DLR8_9HYPH|nr:DUF3341 domain-containing protein [Tianweitania populi]GHD05008.1 hypothetical protein GCM10016234_00350 [Tianweitania populi]